MWLTHYFGPGSYTHFRSTSIELAQNDAPVYQHCQSWRGGSNINVYLFVLLLRVQPFKTKSDTCMFIYSYFSRKCPWSQSFDFIVFNMKQGSRLNRDQWLCGHHSGHPISTWCCHLGRRKWGCLEMNTTAGPISTLPRTSDRKTNKKHMHTMA